MDENLQRKMISHRLRGFGGIENGLVALANACQTDIPYLEVDTRVSRDKEIYLHHDANLRTTGFRPLAFGSAKSSTLNQVRWMNGESLLSLRVALERYRHRKRKAQILCLDIKDYGFEERHLRLVYDAHLQNQVYFVSWVPRTLIRLYELGVRTPLFLSHRNLFRWGSIGSRVSKLMEKRSIRFASSVIGGKEAAVDPLKSHGQGYDYSLICRELADVLVDILSQTNGGICVHTRMAGKALAEYCRKSHLRLWVYSVQDLKGYIRYSQDPLIDGVFCEDAATVFRLLTAD
jgi:glycerophosphoryl diester phosphodiesterase